MRSYATCLWLLYSTCGMSQSWCAPGASWHHEYAYTSWGDVGFVGTHCAGDVPFADSLCQELVVTEHIYSYQTNTVSTSQPYSFYTTTSGALVHVWTGSEFDTLFHFAAVPGDHWRLPIDLPSVDARITVLDTGHVILDGESIRYQAVDVNYEDIVSVNDTIFERIGPLEMFLNIPISYQFLIDGGHGGLRCYADEEIDLTRVEGPCEIALGIAPLNRNEDVAIWPNPTADWATFSCTCTGDAHLRVTDAQGRVVTHLPIAAERGQIVWDTRQVPAGVYTVELYNAHRRLDTQRMVVQPTP